jgi:hypothetical protein
VEQKKNAKESNLKNKGAREWVPLFLSNDQETPCSERHEHNLVTGKLFPQGHDNIHCYTS